MKRILTYGTYDLLLAHSSSNNGAGSIDPGITGKEPSCEKWVYNLEQTIISTYYQQCEEE